VVAILNLTRGSCKAYCGADAGAGVGAGAGAGDGASAVQPINRLTIVNKPTRK